MSRKNIYIDEETANRLLALTRDDINRPLYASESEAIRAGVERLHRFHFNPTSGASDEVLDRLRIQLGMALSIVEGELMRRFDAAADAEDAAEGRRILDELRDADD